MLCPLEQPGWLSRCGLCAQAMTGHVSQWPQDLAPCCLHCVGSTCLLETNKWQGNRLQVGLEPPGAWSSKLLGPSVHLASLKGAVLSGVGMLSSGLVSETPSPPAPLWNFFTAALGHLLEEAPGSCLRLRGRHGQLDRGSRAGRGETPVPLTAPSAGPCPSPLCVRAGRGTPSDQSRPCPCRAPSARLSKNVHHSHSIPLSTYYALSVPPASYTALPRAMSHAEQSAPSHYCLRDAETST